jgi:hypothetical protein
MAKAKKKPARKTKKKPARPVKRARAKKAVRKKKTVKRRKKAGGAVGVQVTGFAVSFDNVEDVIDTSANEAHSNDPLDEHFPPDYGGSDLRSRCKNGDAPGTSARRGWLGWSAASREKPKLAPWKVTM